MANTPIRNIRVPDELWDNFRLACNVLNRNASQDLRNHMAHVVAESRILELKTLYGDYIVQCDGCSEVGLAAPDKLGKPPYEIIDGKWFCSAHD